MLARFHDLMLGRLRIVERRSGTPCASSAFEIENGLITAWREYFDWPPELRSQNA